ncbi:transketolase [Sinanaerobacter chloroacetimidivorans]|jgi:transketolase|uniref:Transketolase n=1 Tax=Sinanaerobacter chloroacetimidivorans TaxID=2818044 RepID=A0A8J7W1H2_9FIRM|nr:transketolase [Sinanaerobacter chloroacetimidivorans]MBR0597453.1 transketolase [Sinanaerobacter chloroacetimidivorans]
MYEKPDFEKMKRLSADIRIELIKELAEAGFGHIGGSASIADVLAVLYGGAMQIDPENPGWEDRDWLVLSKGHSGPALYAALALKGYFPMEVLTTLNKGGTRLPSHCDRLKTPGIDMTTGSLGQGMSSAVGIALANSIQGRDSYTYCILGDGETQEGQVWEGAQTAAHFKLDHFIAFVDDNKKQIDGPIKQVCEPFDIAEKFRSFGFDSRKVKGYDVEEIYHAIEEAKAVKGKPSVIVLDTIKGLGISFAEPEAFNHYLNIDWTMAEKGIAEIEKRYAEGTYPGGDFKW